MFEALLILYDIFNVIALVILVICCICAIIGNSRINALATAKVALPTFADCKPTFIKCCVVSSVFLLMDWILFSKGYVSETKLSGAKILSANALRFSYIWAIALVLLIVIEMIIKFSKNKNFQMKDALSPVIIRTIWCFVLTFIIA